MEITNNIIAKYLGKASYENPFTRKIEETDIDEFDNLTEELWSGDVPNWVFECDTEDIVSKASHNIIDLIEVGDYVNGYIVLDITKDNLGEKYIECGCKDEKAYDYVYDTFYNKDIKTIVTKEQMEAIQYKAV